MAGPGTAVLPTPGGPSSTPAVPGGSDAQLQSLVDFLMGNFSSQAAGMQP